VENYFGPAIVEGVYAPGMSVDVPMNLTDNATIRGDVTHVRADYWVHSDVRFASYVIMKKSN